MPFGSKSCAETLGYNGVPVFLPLSPTLEPPFCPLPTQACPDSCLKTSSVKEGKSFSEAADMKA